MNLEDTVLSEISHHKRTLCDPTSVRSLEESKFYKQVGGWGPGAGGVRSEC